MSDPLTVTVTKFKMGDAIPPWLLSIEPLMAGAIMGAFRFGTDVDVFDCPEYFAVVPTSVTQAQPRIIDLEGSVGVNVSAAGKPIIVAVGRELFLQTRQQVEGMAALGFGWQPMAYAQPAQQIGDFVPPASKGLFDGPPRPRLSVGQRLWRFLGDLAA